MVNNKKIHLKSVPTSPYPFSQYQDVAGPIVEERSPFISGPYLRGPIPLHWLEQASHLGGQALYLGLLIWHYMTMRKEPVSITLALLHKHHLPRSTSRWALQRLEKQGLVTVQRQGHHAPVVTLCVK